MPSHKVGRKRVTELIKEKVWDRQADADLVASQRIFTTGQIAVICNVAPRTVSKWFDSGKLKGYRLPSSDPLSKKDGDRRIRREDLIAFMQAHGLPLGPLAGPVKLHPRAYLYHVLNPRVKELLEGNGVEVTDFGDSLYDLAIGVHQQVPDVLVVDTGVGRTETLKLLRKVRLTEEMLKPKSHNRVSGRQPAKTQACVIVVLTGDDETNPDEYLTAGATIVRQQSFDPTNITTEAVAALTN